MLTEIEIFHPLRISYISATRSVGIEPEAAVTLSDTHGEGATMARVGMALQNLAPAIDSTAINFQASFSA